MKKSGTDGGGDGEISGVSDTAEIANMVVTRTWKCVYLFGERKSGVKDEIFENIFAEGVGKIGCAVG